MSDLQDICQRIWSGDASVWQTDPESYPSINNRLGWLDSVSWCQQSMPDLLAWANRYASEQTFENIILLGMGGSSLAPMVYYDLLPVEKRKARLMVLDTTSPEKIAAVDEKIIQNAVFIVASKSGGTIETSGLYRYFYDRVANIATSPGERFIAITDENSWLHKHAKSSGFARIFVNPSNIGGRYSALSYFGLVPAAMIGVDVIKLLDNTAEFVQQCRQQFPEKNPALMLGGYLGQGYLDGKRHLCISKSESLHSFGLWVEQLVAESTGKQGKGILPVLDNQVINLIDQSSATMHVCIETAADDVQMTPNPDQIWQLKGIDDLGAEFFRWEFATAVAAAVMSVNPFDEPNVSEAKRSTQEFIEHGKRIALFDVSDNAFFSIHLPDSHCDKEVTLRSFIDQVTEHGYLAVLAYLPDDEDTLRALTALQQRIAEVVNKPVTMGLGPRYLHSTGQLHKGGEANGCFMQLTEAVIQDLAIPQTGYGFADLFRAQADGDFDVLNDKSRPIMRIRLKGDRLKSLQKLVNTLDIIAG